MTGLASERSGRPGLRLSAATAAVALYAALCWATPGWWSPISAAPPPQPAHEPEATDTDLALDALDPDDDVEGEDCEPEFAAPLGLAWLARHQEADGRWGGPHDFALDPTTDEAGESSRTTGVAPARTSLAILAFCEQGHTHRYGRYRDVVKRGAQWISSQLDAQGRLVPGHAQTTRNQALVAYALNELYGRTQTPLLKDAAHRSVERLLATRKAGAAWGSTESDDHCDLAVSGWCLLAISAASAGHVDVPGMREAVTDTAAWIESRTDSADGGSTRTALEFVCRVMAGYRKGDARLVKGLATLRRWSPQVGDSRSAWREDRFFVALAGRFDSNSETWRHVLRSGRRAWVDAQRRDGHAIYGSWDPRPLEDDAGGRVFSTAVTMLALGCLTNRYGFVSVFR